MEAIQEQEQEINNKDGKNSVAGLNLKEILKSQQDCEKINLDCDGKKQLSKFICSDVLKKKAEDIFKKNKEDGKNNAVYFVCNTDGDVKAYEVPIEGSSEIIEDVDKARCAITNLYARCIAGDQCVLIREFLPESKIARDGDGNIQEKFEKECLSNMRFGYIKSTGDVDENELVKDASDNVLHSHIYFYSDPDFEKMGGTGTVGVDVRYFAFEFGDKKYAMKHCNLAPGERFTGRLDMNNLSVYGAVVEHPDKDKGVPEMTPEKFRGNAIEREKDIEDEKINRNRSFRLIRDVGEKKEEGSRGTPSSWIYKFENMLRGIGIGLGFDIIGSGVTVGICFKTGVLSTFSLKSIIDLASSNPLWAAIMFGCPVLVGGLVGLCRGILNTRNEENGGNERAERIR